MSASPTDATTPSAPAGLGFVRFAAIGLLFMLSGAAALIYEVVWMRQLTTLFGATVYAVATVLTAFMGGLALGAWWFGRMADRFERPLLVFGLLEVGIAASAFAFPTLLKLVTPIVGTFYATGGEGTFFFFSLVRFAIAFSLLMIPTTLMGATLPVMSRVVARDFSQIGRAVGGLYALNTLGAVLGVFISGFVLLELLGVWRTTLVGISADLFVAVCCILWGLGMRVPARGGAPAEETHVSEPLGAPNVGATTGRVVLVTYFFSGLVALALQVAWTRSLIFGFDHLKATTYAFAGMLTVFLLGLSIGSALMQAVVDKIRDLVATYVVIQVLIAIFAALTPWLIQSDLPRAFYFPELLADGSGDLNYWGAVGNVMIRTAMVIGVPTLLMGAAFPVVTRMVVGSLGRLGKDVGIVYAANTCGAIVGSFFAGFVLVPMLGISVTIGLLAAIGFGNAVAVIWVHPALPRARRPVIAGLLAAVALVFVVRTSVTAQGIFHPLTVGERMIHYDEGSLATVSVIEDSKGWRTIYVDAVGVAGTDPVLQTDQKSLAHVPMVLLGGRAENVLTVGFGSGGASYSYTLYPEIERIHAVEITTSVPRAAYSLTDANHGILYPRRTIERLRRELGPDERIPGYEGALPSAHPISAYVHEPAPGFLTFDERYRLIVDDARSYLRFTDRMYDVIATDCTDLRYKSNANLYDLEYFRLCRERITDDGLVVVWMPLAGLSDEAFRIVVRTFREVFPDMTVWYFTNEPTHYCLFIGQKGGVRINYENVVRALEELPSIQADMDEIGLNDPAKLVASFVTDQRGIDQYVGEGPLNTEDFPIIEFLSPRHGYDSRPLAQNMARLYDVQVPVWDLIVDQQNPRALADRELLGLYQQANDVLFEGHSQYRLFNFRAAAEHYMRARDIAPLDESIDRLLDFNELRLLLEGELARESRVIDYQWVNAQWIAVRLGEVYLLQERYRDAVNAVAPFMRRHPPPSPELNEELRGIGRALSIVMADSYAMAGNASRAQEYRRTADNYLPPDAPAPDYEGILPEG